MGLPKRRTSLVLRLPLGRRLVALGTVVVFSSLGLAAELPKPTVEPDKSNSFGDRLTAEQLAERIDAQLADLWKTNGIAPAPIASDEEFVRRVHLDLIGRIPSVTETLTFLEDAQPDKRVRLVEELMQRGAWAAHFANTWRDLMLAGTMNAQAEAQSFGLETWLRLRFIVNMPYDQIVKELLTAPVQTQSANAMVASGDPSPAAFYQAAEYKPEQLASDVSRLFLGVQLQCAQCHDHPFYAWKRQQFWEFAAFFQPLGGEEIAAAAPVKLAAQKDAIQIPDTDQKVTAKFLDGVDLKLQPGDTKRTALARWMTSPGNDYFASAAVNRLWDHFFGRGIVSPVDDLDPVNAPIHPQLLDEVAQQFVLHDYDIQYLVRAITRSQAYQRSSRKTPGDDISTSDRQLLYFARIPLRRMTSDQLYSSFVQATGFEEESIPAGGQSPVRTEFQSRFSDTSVPRTEAATSILQALALMNGKYVGEATDLKRSQALSAIIDAPYLDTRGRIEMLFLTTLSRKPNEAELEQMTQYIAAPRTDGKVDEKAALTDVFWSLLNSAEFVLNH